MSACACTALSICVCLFLWYERIKFYDINHLDFMRLEQFDFCLHVSVCLSILLYVAACLWVCVRVSNGMQHVFCPHYPKAFDGPSSSHWVFWVRKLGKSTRVAHLYSIYLDTLSVIKHMHKHYSVDVDYTHSPWHRHWHDYDECKCETDT